MKNKFTLLRKRILYWLKMKIWNIRLSLDTERKTGLALALSEQRRKEIKDIPIFVISFNRLSYLKKMIHNLEKRGYENIHIIDNCSSYPPLLEYYKSITYDVVYLKENLGHMAFWKSAEFDKFRDSFYVVTDTDIIPIEECPNNFLEIFFCYLQKYPFLRKVGFSLKIDDLPKDGILTQEVISWEEQFYERQIDDFPAFYSEIDTTFALYAPDKYYDEKDFFTAVRIGYPYVARHLPWYKTQNDISEEDIYYATHKANGWWDFVKGEMTPDVEDKVKSK